MAEPLKVTKEQVALAKKRILELQAKYQKSEKSTAKYKRRLEMAKKEKEAFEAEKRELQCHLQEVVPKRRPWSRQDL